MCVYASAHIFISPNAPVSAVGLSTLFVCIYAREGGWTSVRSILFSRKVKVYFLIIGRKILLFVGVANFVVIIYLYL